MRILCRSDASVEIGTGHVARCVTLAHALAAARHDTTFVCRELQGNLATWVRVQGFETVKLPARAGNACSEEEDAAECLNALSARRFDWMVVDHYALGAVWEMRGRILRIGSWPSTISDALTAATCSSTRTAQVQSTSSIAMVYPRIARLCLGPALRWCGRNSRSCGRPLCAARGAELHACWSSWAEATHAMRPARLLMEYVGWAERI